jgi:hypothetical protein
MSPSSTARPRSNQSAPDSAPSVSAAREYRRWRNHLFPLEDYRAAKASGGVARSYCGILEIVRRGESVEVEEVNRPSADDCATCVDLWRGRRWVRL